MQSLTVITAPPTRTLTKNLITGETYAKVSRLVAAETREFASLKALKALLQELSSRADQCVIRGVLADDAPTPLKRRRSHFDDVPQAWVMLDIDSVKLPKRLATYPYTDDHAAYVRSLLPDAFKQAGCVWQASASAGLDKRQAKLHLWFLLDAPLSSAQLRQWLKGTEHVDPVTLRVVQPHYTADPIGGPEGKRLGRLKGPRVTTPLDIDAIEPEPIAAELTKRPKGCANVSDAQVKGCLRSAKARCKTLLESSTSAYLDAYKAGTFLGPAVALKFWNDKKTGHERDVWGPYADKLAAKYAARFAELPDTKHDSDTYLARVHEGIFWGMCNERERLSTQSKQALQEAIERTEWLQQSILSRLLKNTGNERALREAGAALGPYKEVIGEENLVRKLRANSGLSESQCRAAIEDARPVDLSAWREGLLMNKEEIQATDENIICIFERYPGFMASFQYNERMAELELTAQNIFGKPAGAVKADALTLTLVGWLGSIGCRKVAMYKVRDIFGSFVEKFRKYDPFLDAFPEALLSADDARKQLRKMKPRLDKWLHKHLGVERNAYTEAAAAKTLIAAVARAVEPGAQADTMLVLMGEQGIGKTTAVKTLARVIPDGYKELLDTRDKDSLLVMQRSLICEVSELRAIRGAQEESLKAFWTRTEDILRAPYARTSEKHKRRMVFIGTTNDDDFLSDRANRRYWPVQCTKQSTLTSSDAVELWREAALRYAAGERGYLEGEAAELQAIAVRSVRAESLYEQVLQKQLKKKYSVSFLEAARLCAPDGNPYQHARGIAQALKALGWTKKHTENGNRWVRNEPFEGHL